jgi:hypothetical protein
MDFLEAIQPQEPTDSFASNDDLVVCIRSDESIKVLVVQPDSVIFNRCADGAFLTVGDDLDNYSPILRY